MKTMMMAVMAGVVSLGVMVGQDAGDAGDGGGMQAVIGCEVMGVVPAGKTFPEGALLIQTVRVFDWKVGDKTVPVPREWQQFLVVGSKRQGSAVQGDGMRLRVRPAGTADADDGQRWRVWRVIEEW
jgi:hypothetical protein